MASRFRCARAALVATLVIVAPLAAAAWPALSNPEIFAPGPIAVPSRPDCTGDLAEADAARVRASEEGSTTAWQASLQSMLYARWGLSVSPSAAAPRDSAQRG